jgi:proteasome accessory factor B
MAPLILSAPNFLNEIIDAISEKKPIEFSYLDSELKINKRKVYVYSYFARQSYWYFTGLDVNKDDLRTFRCDRIVGEIEVSRKTQIYEIPEDWQNQMSFQETTEISLAILRVRKGRGSQLRNIASTVESDTEHDLINIKYSSEAEIISLILWHLDDVEVIAPESLKMKVRASLQLLVVQHG